MTNIEQVSGQFAFQGMYAGCEELKFGNINSTYHLSYRYPHREYILQRINHFVFKRSGDVMQNMLQVTGYLGAKYQAMGMNPTGRVLKLIPLRADGYMYVSPEGEYWRAYEFIEGAKAPDRAETAEQFRKTGRGYGVFQVMLADFPAEKLHVTIPGFHTIHPRAWTR